MLALALVRTYMHARTHARLHAHTHGEEVAVGIGKRLVMARRCGGNEASCKGGIAMLLAELDDLSV